MKILDFSLSHVEISTMKENKFMKSFIIDFTANN